MFEKLPFLASLESLWTNQKDFPSHVNPRFNHGIDWFAFSKANEECVIPIFANRQ